MPIRVHFVPSVKLLALWLAEADYLARHPDDREGCREWADANWKQFRSRASDHLDTLTAARSEPSLN